MNYWTVPQEWKEQTAFVIAGGPSVLDINLELLRGRNIVAINSSIYAVPWAQYLYFGDSRWWLANSKRLEKFTGHIVTTSMLLWNEPKVLNCRKANPPGLALARDTLMQKWTSLTAATNLAVHLVGPGGTIVWLGADGKHRADGRTHHHQSHPWPTRKDAYNKQLADLITIVPTLRELQITALNASPGTAWPNLLPVVRLDEWLSERRAA